jgi:hypothetical protein
MENKNIQMDEIEIEYERILKIKEYDEIDDYEIEYICYEEKTEYIWRTDEYAFDEKPWDKILMHYVKEIKYKSGLITRNKLDKETFIIFYNKWRKLPKEKRKQKDDNKKDITRYFLYFL